MKKLFVAIYGLGEAGRQLLASISLDSRYHVVCLFDDDSSLQGEYIGSLEVKNPSFAREEQSKTGFQCVLLALPSASHKRRIEILNKLRPLKVSVKVLPSIHQLIDCRVSINSLLEFDAGDLLGRDEVAPDIELLRRRITGKNVLVTGAGGSIGGELTKEIIKHNPSQLFLLDHSELALYNIKEELDQVSSINIKPILGSVLDFDMITQVLAEYNIQTLYHAAAYKHVPMVEENPRAGIQNNVFGTLSLLKACDSSNVETFVLISSDKAVRSNSVMGATKRLAEQLVLGMSSEETKTTYSIVRFGNVLDSSGSVIPLFRKQIMEQRVITITDDKVTRYFMSLGEAARLVIQAGALAKGGEVFVLDMGKPIKVIDLATQMIELSGLVVGKDVKISIIGLRPGEKLHEELFIGEKLSPTQNIRIMQSTSEGEGLKINSYYLQRLDKLCRSFPKGFDKKLDELLAEQVEGYKNMVCQ